MARGDLIVSSAGGTAARDYRAVLDELGGALRQATTALDDQALRSPAAAFRAVAAANLALVDVPRFLRALEPLLTLGEPGEYVAAELARNAEQLAEMSRQIAPYRKQLEALLESEQQLLAADGEREEIMTQIADLRRIEQLADSCADLRAQRDALESRADVVARAVADADVGLALAGHELITVTGNVLQTLDEDIRETLRRAADQDRLLQARLAERRATASRTAEDTARLQEQLAAAESEAAAAEAEFERTHTATAARLAALSRYAAANRAISAALTAVAESGPARADTARVDVDTARGDLARGDLANGDRVSAGLADPTADLDEAERRLAAVDTMLADALAQHDRLRQAAQAVLRPKPSTSPASPEET